MHHAPSLDRLDQTAFPTALDASRIPALGHHEAMAMAPVALDRFLALVDTFQPADWTRPTACTRWDVRQLVAHVTAATAAYASRSEFTRQGSPRRQRPYRRVGLSQLDALNELGVDDRAERSPADLITELRAVGPRAVATRRRLPGFLRGLRLPLGLAFPFDHTWISIGYLTDLIATRDVWIHRLDICRATEREMAVDAAHDGRIVTLVVRDLDRKLRPLLSGETVVYDLTGPAGGTWRIGRTPTPAATIRMDALDFCWLAAGRLRPTDAGTRALLTVTGDNTVAERALASTSVAF